MTHAAQQQLFDEAIDERIARGMSLSEALSNLESENPEMFYGSRNAREARVQQPNTRGKHQLRRDWQGRVNALIATGVSPGVAARLVEEESPGLHQRMLDAHNPRATPAPTFAAGDCKTFQMLHSQWRDAIATRVATGLPAYKAVTLAARECGTLRDRLVVAGNTHDRLVRQGKCTCNKNV